MDLICRMSSKERTECADRALQSILDNAALGLEAIPRHGAGFSTPSNEPPFLCQPSRSFAQVQSVTHGASAMVTRGGSKHAFDFVLLSPV
jgi:hypothetical protein